MSYLRLGLATTLAVGASCAVFACTKSDAHPPVDDINGPVPVTTGGGPTDGGTLADGATLDGGGIILVALSAPAVGLALDPSLVYFSVLGPPTPDVDGGPLGAGALGRVPKGGGAAEGVVSGGVRPTDVLLVNNHLVWLDLGTGAASTPTGAVFGIDLGATNPTVTTLIGTLDQPSAIATDGTFVYVAARSAATGVEVDRAPISGGAASTNVTTFVGAVSPSRLVVDATNVYVLVDAVSGGSLLRVPSASGAAESIWDAPSGVPSDVALSAGRAWVTVDDDADRGALVALALPSGAPTTIVPTLTHATRVATDDTAAYYLQEDTLFRVPLDATTGTEPVILAGGLGGATAIAVGDAVYVATSTRGIVRVAK